ncbi:hypothetical protein O6H91_19G039000 [Diphasiastrum complanatum]|uniref:Uncharacterized protein n=1 Tax=Diphasiastrum complanatum TaxID=34168 RepID=A0ACC2AVR5_DIPCM|nr:hypothetical protein O6H91_19G039000 [Diphasiastrum complanatum]
MVFKSKIKTLAAVGLALSMLSLTVHLLLARYSATKQVVVKSRAHTIISRWDTRGSERDDTPAMLTPNIWSAVRSLKSLRPHAAPRISYPLPSIPNNGYLFSEIVGEFHEIRSSICDLVAIARLLNATLVLPVLREVTDAKGISSKFEGFNYIYNEKHFISSLADDVHIVKKLPNRFILEENHPLMKIPSDSATPEFYLLHVLPKLKKKGAIGLLVSGGGCLQNLLTAELAEYQRLRCRVAFHALRFRREIQDLASKMLQRLQRTGFPYLAIHVGLERDSLAYHGCAELFQDVHTELIQNKRSLMRKGGVLTGQVNVDSEQQWLNGLCPLMPEDVGVLLRALGYKRSTRIFISGAELFGGQRILLGLRSVFQNLEDRTTLSTEEERSDLYGPEEEIPPPPPYAIPIIDEKERLAAWSKAGPRPRPLPPPAGRPKLPHELDGWWGWVGESDTEPEPTIVDTRERGHKLIWQALDYILCVEANAFFPSFDEDKSGHPNFASLVMGHRAYTSAYRRTYRPNRKIASFLLNVREHLYEPGRAWMAAVRNMLVKSIGEDGLIEASNNTKPRSFLSHPLPECLCQLGIERTLNKSLLHIQGPDGRVLFGDEEMCPEWIKDELLQSNNDKLDEEADYTEVSGPSSVGEEPLQSAAEKLEDTLFPEGDEDNDPND